MSRLDIVVFGATGYTGKFVVREIANIIKDQRNSAASSNLTFGIAGRSKEKLSQVVEDISKDLNIDLKDAFEKIIVDVNNAESVRNMCERAKIIINCVGPYRFYGEKVIRECLNARTHHVDVSGEPEYLERMQLNYNKEAEEKRIFIVGSCGFDSVPADMGVVFTKKHFQNDLNHVESYMTINTPGAFSFNYATWESAVYGFASSKELGGIRKKVFPVRLPRSKFAAPKRVNTFGYFFDNVIKRYCMDFIGSDKSVVQRTQYFDYEVLNERPVQYAPYFTISNFFYTSMVIMFGLTFSILANFKFGRNLLLKYYRVFSGGMASKKETKFEEMKDVSFKIEFRGKGFSKKLNNYKEQHDEPPTQIIQTEVSGPEPGYITTSRIVLNCALCILQEQDKIPVKGGVLTPGSAFANTSLISRLERDDIKFRVIRNDSLNSTESKI